MTRPESAATDSPASDECRDTTAFRASKATDDGERVSLQELRSELDAIAVITRRLEAALGRTLVAAIDGTRDTGVSHRWAQEGGPAPLPEEVKRLSFAYEQWQRVSAVEGEDVARLWFIGANPWVDDDRPALCATYATMDSWQQPDPRINDDIKSSSARPIWT